MNSSFRRMVLEDNGGTHVHLGAIINPSGDLDRSVIPVHFLKDVVQDVPGVGDKGDTASDDAEVSDASKAQ